MCRFITAVLSKDADIEATAAVFRTYGRECVAFVNSSLAAQIGHAENVYFTTRVHCDCNTLLGSSVTSLDAGDAREIDAARLRRKGWSEAKIARALDQRNDANARPPRSDPSQTSLSAWCALIRDTLSSSSRTQYVGLLLHAYHSGMSEEEIVLRERVTLHATELNEASLAAMREDTIYEFGR